MRMSIAKFFSKHSFNLSVDYGWAKFLTSNKTFKNTRFNFNYRYSGFYIDALADFNPVNIYTAAMRENTKNKNYSASAGYSLEEGNKRIFGNMHIGYSYYSGFNNQSLFASTSLNFKLSNLWYLTAMGNYTTMASTPQNDRNHFTNLQFKVGIKYAFDKIVSGKDNRLKIALKETPELKSTSPAPRNAMQGVIVKLNDDIVASTNKQGWIQLQNIPDGKYLVTAFKNNHTIILKQQDSISIYQNKKLTLQTVKTYTLKGHLTEIKKQYNTQLADITGIIIYAQNTATSEVINTVTDFNGKFSFQLPEGMYNLYIENNRYEIANNRQQVAIEAQTPTPHIEFLIKNKQVKINVKKF